MVQPAAQRKARVKSFEGTGQLNASRPHQCAARQPLVSMPQPFSEHSCVGGQGVWAQKKPNPSSQTLLGSITLVLEFRCVVHGLGAFGLNH